MAENNTLTQDADDRPAQGLVDQATGNVVNAQAGTPTALDAKGQTCAPTLVQVTTPSLPTSSTSTLTSVIAASASTQLLASNTSRKGMYVYNDSTATLYLAFGGTASATVYTTQVPPQGFFEMPTAPVYLGVITGYWASANGNARLTELT